MTRIDSILLILSQSTEPDSQESDIASQATKRSYFFAPLPMWMSFSLGLLMLFMVPASVTHAGFFSFLSSIFSGGEEEKSSEQNTQNVALLQAALNYDPNPSKGGGEITIVGGSALLPDTGPLGTIADVPEGSPTSPDQISTYIVREGDSLSQIAKMFGVSTNTIIWANDISRGHIIHEGQTLIILPVTGLKYSVKKGDTLKGIAKKYKGDVREIANFNDIEEDDSLAIGQVIIIPDGEIGTPRYSASSRNRVVRGSGGPSYVGYYIYPVPGGKKSQGLHGYNAVDFGASSGTPILAAAAGTVIISRGTGWNGGYGKYVVITHANGTQTLYAHNLSNIVPVGTSVVRGQVIGYVGSTGRSTGSHTHFEVRGAKNPF